MSNCDQMQGTGWLGYFALHSPYSKVSYQTVNWFYSQKVPEILMLVPPVTLL